MNSVNIATFSIVAHAPDEQAWGVAVASKFLAVGSVVPWAQVGAGAVATQAFANTSFGPRALTLMQQGQSAEEALAGLIAADEGSPRRQVGLVDKAGRSATYTGVECKPWAGGYAQSGFAVQGNLLAGPGVIEAMAETFERHNGLLPQRLYAALLAGDHAGGDKRGKQSAAILVVKAGGGYGGFNDRWIDYRVDNAPNPVEELGELLRLHTIHNETSARADQVPLQGEILQNLQILLAERGFYAGDIHGKYDATTRQALGLLVAYENINDRTDLEQGRIDQIALDFLLKPQIDADKRG
ncbi:MAG: DUF1028 domain-containing protein [Chloroflexi bacterium]|nr:DUF1028 domain-containing protein [Chloroflexota bacterium]